MQIEHIHRYIHKYIRTYILSKTMVTTSGTDAVKVGEINLVYIDVAR